MEEWRDIEGYENYQVSNMGNVRSLNFHRTGRVRLLRPGMDKYGYLLVVLCKDGHEKTITVHRLVAQAFLSNPGNLPQVNHKNEIKTDNRAENLEWCDSKYNNNYGSHNQRMAETKSIPVAQYSKEGNLIAVFYGIMEVERQTGIDHSNIAKCCNGRRKSVGGYIWKYV